MIKSNLTKDHIAKITAKEVEELANRLEQDDYINPFDSLEDWHLLRAIAFEHPELVETYLYLLDIQPYDES
jgi:Protein of unknown function (DUF2555)